MSAGTFLGVSPPEIKLPELQTASAAFSTHSGILLRSFPLDSFRLIVPKTNRQSLAGKFNPQ